jgi:hypothetical protein
MMTQRIIEAYWADGMVTFIHPQAMREPMIGRAITVTGVVPDEYNGDYLVSQCTMKSCAGQLIDDPGPYVSGGEIAT